MAHDAIVPKGRFAVLQNLRIVRQRVVNVLASHGDFPLGPFGHIGFSAPRSRHAASRQQKADGEDREPGEVWHHHSFPVTCTSIAMRPWPSPQKWPHWP